MKQNQSQAFWKSLNWDRPISVIAAETNRTESTIRQYKTKFAPRWKRGGDSIQAPLTKIRSLKGLVVQVGKEKLSIDRLKNAAKETVVTMSSDDFWTAWTQKGEEFLANLNNN